MRQLFIPEIGTHLKLTQDWTFDLYDESRNKTLLAALDIKVFALRFNYDGLSLLSYSDKVDKNLLKEVEEFYQKRKRELDIPWIGNDVYRKQSREEFSKALDEYHRQRKENFQILVKEVKERLTDDFSPVHIKATIPSGSTLAVDRIYIRKGMEGYSSVTFYWKDRPLNMNFKKAVRFWAKLDDVNKIQFEDEVEKVI